MTHRFLRIVLAAFLVTYAAGDADAKPPRRGVTAGVGLGGGTISCGESECDDFEGAGSFDAHIGGMLSPRLALTFDVWWMLHRQDRFTVEQGILTAAVRFWPVRHFWLQGGLGAARAGLHYKGSLINVSSRTEWVPAFHVGIGVEPVATKNFGLDISLRYGTGFYSDGEDRIHNASLNVGVSFY